MTGISFGKLERVSLREVWTHEAYGFTPWLAREDNLKMLSETVRIPFTLDALESPVGTLRVDILARRVQGGQPVIVENQLGCSDHKHLGQITTYAALLESVAVIWIAETFSEEHKKALHWMNKAHSQDVQFYAVELALYRIGHSEIAPLFTLVSTVDRLFRVDTKARHRGQKPVIPVVPGINPAVVERVILAHLAGTSWRNIPMNYSRTTKPIKEAWEKQLASQ